MPADGPGNVRMNRKGMDDGPLIKEMLKECMYAIMTWPSRRS
jgi:hypothetical protein